MIIVFTSLIIIFIFHADDYRHIVNVKYNVLFKTHRVVFSNMLLIFYQIFEVYYLLDSSQKKVHKPSGEKLVLLGGDSTLKIFFHHQTEFI